MTRPVIANAVAMKRLQPSGESAARDAVSMRHSPGPGHPQAGAGPAPFFMGQGQTGGIPCVGPSESELNEFLRELSSVIKGSRVYCDFRPEIVDEEPEEPARLAWTLRLSVPSRSPEGACWHTVLAEVQCMYKHTDSTEHRQGWNGASSLLGPGMSHSQRRGPRP